MSPADLGVCLQWIHLDPVFVHLCSYDYRLDPSNLRFSSSAAVAILVRLSSGALARQHPKYIQEQGLPGSGDGGVMMATPLRLVSMLMVLTRWFMDLDVIFTSGILCTHLTFDE